ncbi:N-alpha-acetyltransferase 60 isoform X2 [Dermacentor albipictus]|uniref:N-alpha-acetyltransferase 60 isoform X2 n=1 Tax=Dermacentor albipictus TaxID=60249 RepID=UPI0031FD9717
MLGVVPLASDSNVQLRFLAPDDAPEVRRLCTDWFPIEYPDSWYHDITSNPRFFALAAMYGGRIIGLIVAESKAQSQCNREDAGLLATNFPPSAQVAYILTLGVVRECRRNGIATLLLDSLLAHLSQQQPQPGCGACKAVYLHVLASNTCAIQFYERRCFRPHAFLPLYYSVRGAPRDGYSYVLYINGGHPPWTLLYPFQTMALHGHLWACCGPARTLIKHTFCALRAKADKQLVQSIHSAVCELVPAVLHF